MPDWAQAFGAALLVGAMALFFLTFRANPFLSPAVRMQSDCGQSDRGQSVVSATVPARAPPDVRGVPCCAA